MSDLRYALRALARSPGFTAVAVLTLGLGIGATATVLSIGNALLLRAVPFPEADRLVALTHQGDGPVAPATVEAWREHADVFDAVAAYGWLNATLAGAEAAERLQGFRISPGFFSTLGVDPAVGRAFLPGEDEPGRDGVVLISHGFWQDRFGADPAAAGETLLLDGEPHTIVGVMPPEASFPPGAAVWTPLFYNPASQGRTLEVIARLAPGVSMAQARTALATIQSRLERQFPDGNLGAPVELRPLAEYQTRFVRPLVLILLGAVGFVLLIACANIANLLLARATSRGPELAVRKALGAGQARVIRQLLTESLVLALLGGALGVAVGLVGVELFRIATPPDTASQVAGWETLGLDARVLATTLAVAALSGIAFGLAPAWSASRGALGSSLRSQGALASGRRTGRGRAALVVAQVSLAVVLLAGAGLMVRSFNGLLRADPGFRSQDVLTMQLVIPRSEYARDPELAFFHERLLEAVRELPGVRSAGIVSFLPYSGVGGGAEYRLVGEEPAREEAPFAQYRRISPGYLEALEIPLVEGRVFRDADDDDAPAVALVSRGLAERHWPGADLVGREIEMYGTAREIVGVVGDVYHWGAADGARPTVYVPEAQDRTPTAFLALRAVSEPAALAPAVRRLVGASDPRVAVAEVKTMDRVISDLHAADRLMAGLLGAFALLALVIAAVGIYGVVAFTVARRTREIGLRATLGAEPRRLLGWLLRKGLGPAALGLAVGLAAALALSRLMESLLFGVSPGDPMSLAFAAVTLAVSALLATYIPARRAVRADPTEALRHE